MGFGRNNDRWGKKKKYKKFRMKIIIINGEEIIWIGIGSGEKEKRKWKRGKMKYKRKKWRKV